MNIFFARHGQTSFNRDNKMQGLGETPLTTEGKKYIHKIAVASANYKINRIYVSNILRAKQTAKIYQNTFNASVEIDDRLNEIDVGDFEGKLFKEVKEDYSYALEQWQLGKFNHVHIPNGEKFSSLEKRIKSFLDNIIQEGDSFNADHSILVVSHFVVIKSIISILLTQSLSSSNGLRINLGNITKFSFEKEKGWALQYMNLPIIN
jgi:broad specificity phosphatase PhoE